MPGKFILGIAPFAVSTTNCLICSFVGLGDGMDFDNSTAICIGAIIGCNICS
jgi:hypothetical protein